MTIRIVNSLTREKQELVPAGEAGTREGKIIRMYSCGVTVYDRCHIGHARSLYIFEVIRRYLKFRGYDVRFARNITDVDDKIINKARETKKSFEDVVAENIAAYYEDLKSLGIPPADIEPRATENIPEMIQDIQGLIQKGFAYTVNGDVYYDVRKFKEYGKLSGQSVDRMMEAVRIEQDGRKKDPLDFALWKKSKEDEPFWESPWGRGRPGWHIECSCMSRKHLGCETLDIHAGGRDLIFPHHENEIAQAEPLTGKPFAKYWIHHGLLTINGQKMAKSLGNFITVQDALKKYSVDQLKLFFLSSHYASPIDFTPGKMEEAHRALQRFEILLTRVSQMNISPTEEAQEMDFIGEHRKKFFEAMDDDFNTPKALGHLFDLVTATNKFIEAGQGKRNYAAIIEDAVATVTQLCTDIFGLSLSRGVAAEGSEEVEHLLKQREQARAKKDFKRSDKLRDALKEKGIIVEDTKDGQVWRRA